MSDEDKALLLKPPGYSARRAVGYGVFPRTGKDPYLVDVSMLNTSKPLAADDVLFVGLRPALARAMARELIEAAELVEARIQRDAKQGN